MPVLPLPPEGGRQCHRAEMKVSQGQVPFRDSREESFLASSSFRWLQALCGSSLHALPLGSHASSTSRSRLSLCPPCTDTPGCIQEPPNNPGSYRITIPNSITSANCLYKSGPSDRIQELGSGHGGVLFSLPYTEKENQARFLLPYVQLRRPGKSVTHAGATSPSNYLPRARHCSQC